MSFAKAREPVTFVRSPTFTNSESSPMLSGSSPARRIARLRSPWPSPADNAGENDCVSGNRELRFRGQPATRHAADRGDDRANVVGRRAAATADDVDEAA